MNAVAKMASTWFPFDPLAVSSGFNATMETDFLLNASHGFVSSEGWFAEDLQQRLAINQKSYGWSLWPCDALCVHNEGT